MIFSLKLAHVIGNELVSKQFSEVVRKILGGLKKPSKMLCDKKEGFETSPNMNFNFEIVAHFKILAIQGWGVWIQRKIV